MSIVAAIRTMLEKGLSLEHALIAAEALEETIAPVDTRSTGAIRQANYRDRKRNESVTERNAVTVVTDGDAKVSPPSSPSSSSPPIPPLITTTPSSPPSKTRSASATAGDVLKILSECLAIQTATDLIAHRKALKSPLTVGSARGLVKNFQEFGDPEAAALSMMANGWRGFKSDWMKTELKIVPKERDLRSVPDNLLSADDYWKKRKQQREWA